MPSVTASVARLRPVLASLLRCILLALPLWVGLLRLPAPFSIEIFDARPMALDYAVRHGVGLGRDLPAATGPLGALLTSVHSGEPLWLNFWCQLLVTLAFALGLSWIVWRTAPPVRWWLLGASFIIAGSRPEYLQATLLLLAGLVLINGPVERTEAAGLGVILGLLALIDVQFALLGLVAVVLSRVNPPAGDSAWAVPLLAGAAMLAVFMGGWFWAGQSAGDLLSWLGHGLAGTPLRHPAAAWTGSVIALGVVTLVAILTMLAGTVLTSSVRKGVLASAGLASIVVFLAWRQATGQPEAGPQAFFAVAIMMVMGWLACAPGPARHPGLRWPAIGAVTTACLGLLLVEPRLLTEPIILLNQRIAANVSAMTNRRAWQRGLNDSFRSFAGLFALPRIKAATAGQRTGFLGNAIGYALVNRLELAAPPGLQGFRVADPATAARDAAFFAGPAAPRFVVQRLQAFDRGLPALEDAPAQLALLAGYDFQFEENGFVLWQRRTGGTGPVALGPPVWQAQAEWDQTVVLPLQPGRAYWLKIRVSRSVTGWLKNQLLAPADPVLLLRDEMGDALSYRVTPGMVATGFLLSPLFRGEIDLIRYQAGETLASIREITLQKPAGGTGDFAGPVEITLHEVPVPAVSGRKESAEAFAQRFRIANRLPVAATAYFPPQTARFDGQEVLLAHPDSSLEFPLHAGDQGLQGRFGLLEGAYLKGGDSDGVEFVAEYVPARGEPRILWRRYLDPVRQPGDRGVQEFSLALPQPVSGRVVLRTQNLPGHGAAWDWSLWTDLRFIPPPATK